MDDDSDKQKVPVIAYVFLVVLSIYAGLEIGARIWP